MVLAEARIYTSSPVQSAFHYLRGALHSAGFDDADLQRPGRADEVSLVIWRPAALSSQNHSDDASSPAITDTSDLDPDGVYACGIQGNFTRLEKKRKITFSWELRLDYEPPREHGDNTNRLYHVDIQCILREDKTRRPTETISFHYNNDPHPPKWDVVRNWVRFALDLRALNPPAWATLNSRPDVGEVVIDSINRRSMDWQSPPASPVKPPAKSAWAEHNTQQQQRGMEAQMKQFARHVWREWAVPNIERHGLCESSRRASATARDKARGNETADSGFAGCDGKVDWEAAGQRHDSLRQSLDGYRSPRMSRSSSSTTTSSETRTLRENYGRYRLGDVDEDLYEDEGRAWA